MLPLLVCLLTLKVIAAIGLHSAACGWHVEAVNDAGMKRDWFYHYARFAAWPVSRFL
jgi:hypothetical protein